MNNEISVQATLLDFLQQHLRQIRGICNWSGNEMAEVLGVTRQTVSNLETGKTKLLPSLYLAIGAMIEKRCRQSPLLKEYLDVCFARFPNSLFEIERPVAADTLVESWFSTFPEQFSKAMPVYEPSSILKSRELMLHICRDCKILICPGILLHERRLDCVEELCEMAREQGNSLILPWNAFREIDFKLSDDSAQRIQRLVDAGLLAVYGSKEDPPLNKLAVQLFLSLSTKYSLAFITDDDKLASDLRQLNFLKTVSGNPVLALTIDNDGLLRNCFPADAGMDVNERPQTALDSPLPGSPDPDGEEENAPSERSFFAEDAAASEPEEDSLPDYADTRPGEAKTENVSNFLQASAFADWGKL